VAMSRLFALRESVLGGLACRMCVAAAALLSFVATSAPAAADELVRFAGDGDPIQGYLTKPKGRGPFPAVVLLHTCLGLPEARAAIGERIAGWGYVALFVDDFGARGLKETCAIDFKPALSDAYGALAYVASLSGVNPASVAAVGFSQGGDTALQIASGGGSHSSQDRGATFKAAAAFYPPCANIAGFALAIPTLILVGAKDEVTPATDCVALAARQRPNTARLVVFPGAAHAFDLPEFGGGTNVMGMRLAYDRTAAQRSWAELRSFLGTQLKR
jgi:dienelactone hydrolase